MKMARAIEQLRQAMEACELGALTLPDQIDALMDAGKAVLKEAPTLTPPNETPPCYQPDGDGCAYQCYDGDDEPIDKCKECPLCYSDKQRHHAPPNGPLTQADLDAMDYDKVWLDYEDGTGEWAIVCTGYIYSIDTLEGAGFDFEDYVRGEKLEPRGYKVYRRPLEGET